MSTGTRNGRFGIGYNGDTNGTSDHNKLNVIVYGNSPFDRDAAWGLGKRQFNLGYINDNAVHGSLFIQGFYPPEVLLHRESVEVPYRILEKIRQVSPGLPVLRFEPRDIEEDFRLNHLKRKIVEAGTAYRLTKKPKIEEGLEADLAGVA
ncbi:MAG: hypothetical protein V1740_02280 [Candidatus Woesearchaeota archaeon]